MLSGATVGECWTLLVVCYALYLLLNVKLLLPCSKTMAYLRQRVLSRVWKYSTVKLTEKHMKIMRLVEEEMHERRGCVGGGLGGWNLWYVDGVTLIATLREEWRKLACAVKRHSENYK